MIRRNLVIGKNSEHTCSVSELRDGARIPTLRPSDVCWRYHRFLQKNGDHNIWYDGPSVVVGFENRLVSPGLTLLQRKAARGIVLWVGNCLTEQLYG